MARFHTLPPCPLAVQFWLLGLDARNGDLTRLGYRKTAMPTGSSAYTREFLSAHTAAPATATAHHLQLHSTGLTLTLPEGTLHYERRTGRFRLNGQPLPASQGRALARPYLHQHEAAICQHHGPQWRQQQLQSHALPAPIRRTLPIWTAYMQGLEAQTWQPYGVNEALPLAYTSTPTASPRSA